jgi:hypothetical protein
MILTELILIKSELNVNWFMFGYINQKWFLSICVVWIVWTKIDFECVITKMGMNFNLFKIILKWTYFLSYIV